MKKVRTLLIAVLLVSFQNSNAQFFEKVDEDFKFNGTELKLDGSDHTKDCSMLEETESYRVWVPKNEIVKGKGFTLQRIRYYTNFRNEIWQISAINTGDIVEQAKLKLDMADGASTGDTKGTDSTQFIYYRHMRTYDVFYKPYDNDTATVYILMRWYTSQTEDYRKYHSFFPMIGKYVKDEKVKEFLFAYQSPDVRQTTGELKRLKYYQFGLELFLRNDTIMQATVFNIDKKYAKYPGEMPYELSLDDTRQTIREKLGKPGITASDNSAWYYTRDNKMQIHVRFSNGVTKRDARDEDRILSIVFAL